MNNIKVLQEILNIVHLADKQITQGTPLYKIKSLFDDLNLNGFIDFDTVHGELIQLVLDAKRKDVAAVNIIRARSVLESSIKEIELEQMDFVSSQKDIDDLAIESTCEVVSVPRNDKETQLQLSNMPKKLGRPKSKSAMSSAQRCKKARDKKKSNNLVTINTTLSKHESELYNIMVSKGYDLNHIVTLAYGASPTSD
jgi:hypothetical protein